MKAVPRDHAGEQDDDLGRDQKRRRDLDQHRQRSFKESRNRPRARGDRLAGRRLRQFCMSHGGPLRQLADGFLQQRPRLLAVFSFPFGIEPGGTQFFAEWRRIRLVER